MFEQEKKKKVGFNIEPSKWESFKIVAKANNSDTNKELRKYIDKYLAEKSQLLMKLKSM